MPLEFSSARPPGMRTAGRPWQRSYWPGGVLFAAGLALRIPGSRLGNLAGQVAVILGGCLLGVARELGADPDARQTRAFGGRSVRSSAW